MKLYAFPRQNYIQIIYFSSRTYWYDHFTKVLIKVHVIAFRNYPYSEHCSEIECLNYRKSIKTGRMALCLFNFWKKGCGKLKWDVNLITSTVIALWCMTSFFISFSKNGDWNVFLRVSSSLHINFTLPPPTTPHPFILP